MDCSGYYWDGKTEPDSKKGMSLDELRGQAVNATMVDEFINFDSSVGNQPNQYGDGMNRRMRRQTKRRGT